jgi:hypothetical protein
MEVSGMVSRVLKYVLLLASACTNAPNALDNTSAVADKVAEPAQGRDVARCLLVAEAADARAVYCASLSPAIRRARCIEHATDSVADRRAWCLAEWEDKPPVDWKVRREQPVNANLPDCDGDEECPCPGSPILLDVNGDGFALTDAANGVSFDLRAKGRPEQFAWTALQSDDGWLVLDRNRNGAIDNGSEMFGNYTDQPPSGNPNGFIALAKYDEPDAGGNLDSLIDARDAVYSRLRLWQDRNHNGASEVLELASLPDLGIAALSLDYSISALRDEHGNLFRYRAKVRGMQGARVGPFSYDVFLVVAPSTSPPENDELGSTTSLGWRCKGRCRQMPKPGHDPALCQPLLLNSLGYGITEHTACIDAQLNCLTSMDLADCDLVSGSLQCYGGGLASKPPVCEK